MKKYSYLIIIVLISSLVFTGCLLSNVGQVPTSEQSGITYLTKALTLTSLVGLWHFDEVVGTTASDSSGNDNPGTLVNGPTWEAGKFGNALSFDGTDDYVQIVNESNFDFERTDALTLEAWVKTSSNACLNIITKMQNALPNTGYQLIKHDNTRGNVLYFFLINDYDTGNMIRAYGSTNIADGQWHHVAVTYDGSFDVNGVQIYVDGNAETMGSSHNGLTGSILNDLPLQISGREGSDYAFSGLIDEVRIWNTATPSFNLNVEPKLDFNPVGTNHTVTATVTIDKVGGGTEPAPGVLVDFTVLGVNDDTDSVLTDSNGEATFTYTGDGGAGEDTIMATLNYPFYQATPNSVDKYWLENFVTGGGKINIPGGKKAAWTFAGTVGNLEDGSVGQFQIVDHTNKIAYHCNNEFSYLVFSGAQAESPIATHNTAEFTGTFTNNRDATTEEITVTIKDLGEPGAGVDMISVTGVTTVIDDILISGGNFQVHNL